MIGWNQDRVEKKEMKKKKASSKEFTILSQIQDAVLLPRK